MKKRVIHVPLTVQGVDKAIEELNNYKKWLFDCIKRLVEELGQEGIQISSLKFGQAVYDGTNDVKVSIEKKERLQGCCCSNRKCNTFYRVWNRYKIP